MSTADSQWSEIWTRVAGSHHQLGGSRHSPASHVREHKEIT